MSRNFKQFFKLAAISLVVACGIVLLSWQTFFNQINDIAYDFTQRLAGPLEPLSPTLIVAVDEESLDRIGGWPWRREVLAELVIRVSGGSPRAIGVDLILDDARSEESDQALAEAIRKVPNLVLPARLDDSQDQTRWAMPLDIFRGDEARIGHIHADPDLDGVIRRIETAKQAEGQVVFAFSVEILRVAGHLPTGFEQQLGSSVRIAPESLMIRFAGDRGTFPHISAWEVLEDGFDLSTFDNRIVLVGVTAEGSGDDWMTPFSAEGRRMSGIEIHANVLESIYSDRQVRPVADFIVLAVLAALILALQWGDRRFEGKGFYTLSIASIPVVIGLSWILMAFFELWMPFPPFLATVALVVPALEVGKLVRVNWDLDEKISKLSVWAAEGPRASRTSDEDRAVLLGRIGDDDVRDRWGAVLQVYEEDRVGREERRAGLLGAGRHNASWKLDAVDFFNDQLYRFVSFNKAVLAGIEDVILVADPAGHIVYQNPAAERLTGYSTEPPATWDYLSRLLDRGSMVEKFAAVFSREAPQRMEFVPSVDQLRFYTVTLAPIEKIGVVITLNDVTAQHELNQAKSDMVSLVSHELRTPLTSIRGYSEMLAKYGLVDEKGVEFLRSIIGESNRLNELIQSFLDIAYIESGRKKLNVTEFEPAKMLDELIESHRPIAEKKGISIEKGETIEADFIRGDRVLLYQAMANLVSNAIKYSPSGGRVRLDAANGDGRARFRVEDEGYGIPSEDAGRVFEKFYRRGDEETRDESGFGLGLSFVREIAIQHGGDVTLESQPGKGSVFSLWIPS